MNLGETSIVGPFTNENLSIYLILGPDSFDGSRFIALGEALEQKKVIVHETGSVGRLEVENLSETLDLYIQSGEVVKGGRQDRTLGVDFVLPAKSGRVPIPSFCVESGRWSARAAEAAVSFSCSNSSLATKELRLAAKLSMDQGQVWQSVADAQQSLSESLSSKIYCASSPTSYQLSMEHEDLQKSKEAYRSVLGEILTDHPDAVGFAYVINGEINTADAYGSRVLFRKLWPKMLDAAVIEAISESHKNRKRQESAAAAPDAESVRAWIIETQRARLESQREVPPRVCVNTSRSGKTVVFDTCDRALADTILHKNLVMS